MSDKKPDLKMTVLDRIVNYFDPIAGLKRARARTVGDAVRNYDISSRGRRTDGWHRPGSTGQQEVSKGHSLGAFSAQELGRNNPLANRVKRVWANNAVGRGIQNDITGSSDSKAKKFQRQWDDWCENTECDFEGHYDFYGLQWLWITTVVESGGVFIRKHINAALKFPLQLQTIEQSQLDKGKGGENIIDGIQYDKQGQVEGYWFIIDNNPKLRPESKFYPAKNVIHIYRKERVGQHLGMTWLAPVAMLMRDYETYKDAKLMQQQIAALFALIVEDADDKMGVGSGTKGTKDSPDELEPAMIQYVRPGTKPHTITPPKADNSVGFDTGLKRDMAVGSGITYEQLTGDYSLVNWASGRMGRSEFYSELDFVQNLMLKPKLNVVFSWFDDLYQIINGRSSYSPDWTFPPRAAVNPVEEFDVLMRKVRSGMLSPTKAAKQLGERLERVIEQWKKDKVLFGDLPFDLDPSKFASTGNQLDDNDAASSNKDGSEPGDSSKPMDSSDE